MKSISLTISFIVFYINIFAQIGINTDGAAPDSKAILDVSSTTKGVLFPRMTSDQRTALSTTIGLTVFDINTNSYWFYNGISWVEMVANTDVWTKNGNIAYFKNLTGNVGIGTDTPDVPLVISSIGGSAGLKVKATTNHAQISIESQSGDGRVSFLKQGVQAYTLASQNTGDFILYQYLGIGPAIKVKSGNGYIGLGHESPLERLDIHGRMRIRHSTGATAGIWYGNSANSILPTDGAFLGLQNDQTLGIYMGNSWKMSFTNLGNMTIAGTLSENSDERLKTNFIKLTNPIKAIESLNGYHYNWIATDRDPKLQTGLIAQEVEKTMPELVSESSDGIKSVNYSGLIPYLIESIKILNQEIIQLKKQRL